MKGRGPADLRHVIGRRYASEPRFADGDALRAYALATNDPNPRYLEGEQVAPPLFTVRLFRPLITTCMADPDLDLDALRLVHVEQEMTWHAPLRAGEAVDLQAELLSAVQRRRGCLIAWRMRAGVCDEARVEARFGVFVHGQKLPGVEPGATLGERPRRIAEPRGESTPIGEMTVAADQPARYAAASLDDNPIHLDESAARAAGHPAVILHGLCTMAFAAKAVVDGTLGSNPGRLRRFSVRFSRPVRPGWRLTTRLYPAVPTRAGRSARGLDVVNQDGLKVITRGRVEIDPR